MKRQPSSSQTTKAKHTISAAKCARQHSTRTQRNTQVAQVGIQAAAVAAAVARTEEQKESGRRHEIPIGDATSLLNLSTSLPFLKEISRLRLQTFSRTVFVSLHEREYFIFGFDSVKEHVEVFYGFLSYDPLALSC